MAHMSQRFCLRWNNHQANLLSVFDQLLHDESFVDVTLAVDGQYLRAHKMVLSACSPYFQALFVSHPENHPIVILNDVPFADMRCLLDFMYRGEVSVDQDRLTAFLKVAESLRIKGLTEVNEEKCDLPSIASSLLSGNGGSEGGSSSGDGGGTQHHNQHVQSHHHNQHHYKSQQHQSHHYQQQQQQMQQLTQSNLSSSQPPPPPSLHRIQLSQPLSTSLSPSMIGAGASNNSRSSNNNSNAVTKLHIPSSSSGHAPPDLLEVDMKESQHSPHTAFCDEQILASPSRGKNTSRDVSSDDSPYIKSEPNDDIAATTTSASFQECDSSPRLKEGSISRPQSRTSSNNQSDRYPPEPEISICLEDNENDDDNNYDYDDDIEEEEDEDEDEEDEEDEDGDIDDDVRIQKKKKRTSNGEDVHGERKFALMALTGSNDPSANKRGGRSRQNNFGRRGRLFGTSANFTTFMTTGPASSNATVSATNAGLRLYRFSTDSKDKLPQQYYHPSYVVDYLEGAENEKMDDDQNKEEQEQDDDNNNEDEYNECIALANVPAAGESLSSKNSRSYVVISNSGDDSNNSSHFIKSGVSNAGNVMSANSSGGGGGGGGSTNANVSTANVAANGDSGSSGASKNQQPSKPLDKSSVRRYCVQVAEHLFQCTLCFKTYTHISNFSRHFLSAHHGIRQEIPCPVCFRIFTRRDNMLTHMKQVHRITVTRGLATSLIQKLSTGGSSSGGNAGNESTASGTATATTTTTTSTISTTNNSSAAATL